MSNLLSKINPLPPLYYSYRWLSYHLQQLPPVQVVLLGYLSYMILGWLLLCLPFMHEQGNATIVDHLFIASSAVSTTGLVTVSVSDTYSFFGELVILILIQIGGLGYMTFGSFVILVGEKHFTRFREKVAKSVFTLPKDVSLKPFLRNVILFTIIIESIGTICLYPYFQQANVPNPLWQSIFHSISAFCTAGFSLFNNSFESYTGNASVNIILAVLCYSGAVGFIVFTDIAKWLFVDKHKITFTSKLIVSSTVVFGVIGWCLVWAQDDLWTGMSQTDRLLASGFQVMNAFTTAGFNSVPIKDLSAASIVLIIIFMMIGSSPSGTGGGIKVTTVTAMIGLILSTMRGQTQVSLGSIQIPDMRVRTAATSLMIYVFTTALGFFFITLVEPHGFQELLFEVVSALGTVGLSLGITGELNVGGKWVIIMLMFIGRVGPLSVGMAFLSTLHINGNPEIHEEDLAV